MGGTRHRRIRLATSIYADRYGVSIVVRGKEHRFPLGTPTDELRKERKRLLDEAGPVQPRRGTLTDDVRTYLATLPEDIKTGLERRRRKSDAARLLNRWLIATTTVDGKTVTFGELPRAAITSVMVRTQLAAWRTKGVKQIRHAKQRKVFALGLSESTCDHLRRELGTLYTTLNGKEGYNPVRAVPKFAPKYDDPRGFDPRVMDLIIDSMPDRGKPPKGGTIPTLNTGKVRIRVMYHCGIPPQTLRRVTPRDINLSAKTLRIHPRRKGDGAKGRLLPVSNAAVDALRDLVTHNLFGWFDEGSLNVSFKRAAKRYREQWAIDHPNGEPCPVPEDLHAYDVRHCFGSELFRRTGDKKIVGHLLGHAENSTATDRYIQAAVDDVARDAIAVLNQAASRKPKVVGFKNARTRIAAGRSHQ